MWTNNQLLTVIGCFKLVVSSCSLSLNFLTIILNNDCLTQNNVMFGINKTIGGWWRTFFETLKKTFELLELLSYSLNFGDHLFVFVFGFMNKYAFGLWILF
jgi:hypothetical protein